MERCADLVSVFFGTYGGTLCRSAIWFWDSSVLMVVRCADLVPVFFDIYGDTLGRSAIWFLGFFGTYGGMLCRSWFLDSSIFIMEYAVPIWFLYSGFFDVSLMFASVPCSGFFLSAGSVSQRKVASGRAAAEEG
ncbi:MAG: hypothetical protein ACLSBD_01245 [Blautia massiliensis (ex Durand et al. 2017)]